MKLSLIIFLCSASYFTGCIVTYVSFFRKKKEKDINDAIFNDSKAVICTKEETSKEGSNHIIASNDYKDLEATKILMPVKYHGKLNMDKVRTVGDVKNVVGALATKIDLMDNIDEETYEKLKDYII